MSKEIIITYETLYELLRREKARPELQSLDPTLYKDIINYLEEKKSILKSQETKDSIFAPIEAKKTKKQLEQIYKIIKELYEKRESKIIQLALIASRTDQENTPSMLPEEAEFYKDLIEQINTTRKGILYNLLEGRLPRIEKAKPLKTLKSAENQNKIIKIINPIPKFIGLDLKTYGPLEKEDILSIDDEIADLLIKKEKAEEI
tara:strand:+ start:1939 stop:2550 length:612 start_codon:yes stop_codon:yes gene_type:complete